MPDYYSTERVETFNDQRAAQGRAGWHVARQKKEWGPKPPHVLALRLVVSIADLARRTTAPAIARHADHYSLRDAGAPALFGVIEQCSNSSKNCAHLAPSFNRRLRVAAVDRRTATSAAMHPAASVPHRWRAAGLPGSPRVSDAVW